MNTWGQYKYCPYENPTVTDCIAGVTLGGSKGGFFEYGKVKVKLDKSIILQGGLRGENPTTEVVPAVRGGASLEAPELKVTGGIGLFTKAFQEQQKWPAALTESWKAAKKAKEAGVNVKIETAGSECFEVPGCVNVENILIESGVAFNLPLKVKITAPWLEKLGSGPCYIGSDEHPIHINLTTEGAGSAGSSGVKFNEEFDNIEIPGSQLVDTRWKIEAASAPKGCGGEYESYIDAGLEKLLEMSSPKRTGIVVLKGNLHDGLAEQVLVSGEATGELP